jgi:transposase
MAKPYSEDLRARVIGAVEGGATIPEATEQCGVSISSVVRFPTEAHPAGRDAGARSGYFNSAG